MRRLGIVIAVTLAVFTLSAGVVDAETAYEVDLEGSTAEVTASFDLYSDDPVNYWTTSFGIPEGSRVVSVEDGQGEINDYSLEGSTLRVETNKAERRSKETVEVEFMTPDVVRSRYNGVRVVSMSLSGYEDRRDDVPDEVTTVVVRSDERILAESHSLGFESSTQKTKAVYEGEGPVNVYITLGDGGETYDHYRFFGDGNLTRADELYSLVPSVTGFETQTAGDRHPVVSLPDDLYDEKVNGWSQGQYRTGGLILVRESVASDDGAPVVLHEVTHSYNERAMRWSRPGVSWFDEGTAQHVEFVATNRIGARQPEIFGETVEWEGDCEDRDGDGDARCVYRLRPRKQPDDLWEYYTSDSGFMVDWSPDDPRNRAFGYAFSELTVRNYVRQNGEESLREVYDTLLSTRNRVTDSRKSSRMVLDVMDMRTDTDMRPCYSESYDEFEACLDKVNQMGDIDEATRTAETVDVGGEGGTPEINVETTEGTDGSVANTTDGTTNSNDGSNQTDLNRSSGDGDTTDDSVRISDTSETETEASPRELLERFLDRLISGIRSLFR